MCGIMGYLKTGVRTPQTRLALRLLMEAIEERGHHASGFAALYKGGEKAYFKAPIPASEIVKTKRWKAAMQAHPVVLIGHARWATHGPAKVNANNHPHVSEDGRYLLVHNGVVNDDLGVKCRTECDTEGILRLVMKKGVTKAVDALNATSKSSYAVLCFDSVTRQLYAFRNTGSPCVIADLTEQIGGIVFCSTRMLLEEALECAGVDTTGMVVKSLKPGWWYRFGASGGAIDISGLEFDEAPAYTGLGFEWDDDEDWRRWVFRPAPKVEVPSPAQKTWSEYYKSDNYQKEVDGKIPWYREYLHRHGFEYPEG